MLAESYRSGSSDELWFDAADADYGILPESFEASAFELQPGTYDFLKCAAPWDIVISDDLPPDAKARAAEAIHQNRLPELLKDWVKTSVPGSIVFRSEFATENDPLTPALSRLQSLLEGAPNQTPPAAMLVEQASDVIESIVDAGGSVHSIDTTPDGSVLIRSSVGNSSIDVEVDESDVAGVAIKSLSSQPIYHDVPLAALRELVGANGNFH